MKTTLNLRTLKRLGVCKPRYEVFKAAHGSKTVTLTEALESNGWDDAWWYLRSVRLTKKQQTDMRLLACDYADHVLHIFEAAFPDDLRPRKAIESSRLFAKVQCEKVEVAAFASAAALAADAAAMDVVFAYAFDVDAAADAADAAAFASAASVVDAADAAVDAVYAAADADSAAERKWQIDKLKALLAEWEKADNKGE